MQHVLDALVGILRESWAVLNESSPFVLFGFTIAALMKSFIPDDFVARQLGNNRPFAVLKAAIFGVPLPLCSCGVIPAAMGLRKQGASRGATTAFLISTPETGVDSIAITYALIDPIMTVFRPVAAFVTALVAGAIEERFGTDQEKEMEAKPVDVKPACCCCEGCAMEAPLEALSRWKQIADGFKYTFGELLADIGLWLLGGIIIAGAIGYFMPDNFFEGSLGSGIVPMLLMLVVGIPLYICATSSTPIAAALLMKGLSPGAALVFLLAGPATNAATMLVVRKMLGKRSLAIYVGSIAVVSLLMGLTLDLLYTSMAIKITPAIGSAVESEGGWVGIAGSIVLVALIARGVWIEQQHHRSEARP
jgi:uncharacterized protein